MKAFFKLIILLFISKQCFAQQQDSSITFYNRIFLPSVDVGFQIPTSNLIETSVKFSTSIEYRFRNNNDFFIRLNYDTYGARYTLNNDNATSNTIQGTVQFSDLFLAPGYRFGDNIFRIMFSAMPGIKFYEFPRAQINNQNILISQKNKLIFTTSLLSTLEYYFDEKSAFTLSIYQNQVWDKVDFWTNGGSAFGCSLGFITSLM